MSSTQRPDNSTVAAPARAKALADLDKQMALVELFDQRFKVLTAQLADGSGESVEEAFRQASLEVFGKDLTSPRFTPELTNEP